MNKRPQIIGVEGVDGAGKSTAIRRLGELYGAEVGKPVFNSVPFEQRERRLPTLEEIGEAGVLLIAEPTYSSPTGTAIREDFLRDGKVLTVPEQAELYADDREELYLELVIPFLAQSQGWVIQSRGLLSSLTYQAHRWPGARNLEESIRAVLALSGNQLELAYAPHRVFIFDLDPAQAQRRIGDRRELDQFERDLPLQERVRQLYLDPAIQAPFREQGTVFHVINASKTPEQIEWDIEAIFHNDG